MEHKEPYTNYVSGKNVRRKAPAMIVWATIENLAMIVREKQAFCFVWPKEGEMGTTSFRFNDEHRNTEPMLIDIMTANLLVTVFEKLSPETKVKVQEAIESSRVKFFKIVDFSWGRVR